MKITKTQLKQIIKEEIESALQSQPRKIPRMLRPVAEYFQKSVESIQSVVTELELEGTSVGQALEDLQALLPNGSNPIDYYVLFTDARNIPNAQRDEHRSAHYALRDKLYKALKNMHEQFVAAMRQGHISQEEWQQTAAPRGEGLVSQFLQTMMSKAIDHPNPAHFRDIVIKEFIKEEISKIMEMEIAAEIPHRNRDKESASTLAQFLARIKKTITLSPETWKAINDVARDMNDADIGLTADDPMRTMESLT